MADKMKARKTVEPCDAPERIFVMDPDGDTIITLKNPGAPFAINPSAAAAIKPKATYLRSPTNRQRPHSLFPRDI